MELYIEKLKAARRRKRITIEELANKMGISRITLGAWENAKRVPSEAKIRMLAKVLDVPANEISDLEPDQPISGINLAPLDLSINSLINEDKEINKNRITTLISGIMGLNKELFNAKLIIGAMLSSLPSVFYIKGPNLKYITANEVFLKNISLNKNFIVNGKTDSDFFPNSEAKNNYEMDKDVLTTGKSILNREGYIPGTRKTKWGLISKIPILDSEGKIEGLVGYFVDITERKKSEEKIHVLLEDLKEKENRFLHIMNSSHDAILLIDGETFVECNEVTPIMLGYATKAEFLLSHPSKLSPPVQPDGRNSFEKANEMMKIAFDKGFNRFEWVHRKASGEDFPVEVSLTPISYHGKKILHCLWRDISERKKAEEAKTQLSYLIDYSLNEIYIFDAVTYKFINVNKGAQLNLGYSMDELKEMTPLDIKPSFTRELFMEMVKPLKLNKEKKIVFCTEHRRKNGTLYPVEVHLQYSEYNQQELFIALILDMTERKRANEELEKISERYKAIFNCTFQFTGLMTPEGILIEANQTAVEFTGMSQKEVTQKPFWETPWWSGNKERVKHLKNAIFRAAQGEFVRYEVELQGKENSTMMMDFSIKPVFDSNGKVIMLISEARDITERKHAEDKVKSLLDEKEALLKDVHHRVKNNMSIISGLLRLQTVSLHDQAAINAIKDADSRIQTMSVLYDKLYCSNNFNGVSLREYFQNLIDGIFFTLLDSSQITIEEKIEDISISTNLSFSLGIIINELLTNIMKYAFKGRDKGKIIVSASKKDGKAVIVIQDDGGRYGERYRYL